MAGANPFLRVMRKTWNEESTPGNLSCIVNLSDTLIRLPPDCSQCGAINIRNSTQRHPSFQLASVPIATS